MKPAANSSRAFGLRSSAMKGVGRLGALEGEAIKPIVHGLQAYRSGKCRCDVCRAAHRIKSAEYRAARAAGVDTSREPRQARIARAKVFLDDGASYAEAAASVGTDEKTLSKDLPGYEVNGIEFNSIMSNIKNNEFELRLHREIWQGGTFNES